MGLVRSAAFTRARDEQKPLLLAISAPWSSACREMDRLCYGDVEIADEINRWFVPVRVDADRRPDVAERYDLGGLPSTVFLTAEGGILGGGTFVPPARFREALTRVRQAAPASSGVSPPPPSWSLRPAGASVPACPTARPSGRALSTKAWSNRCLRPSTDGTEASATPRSFP